MMPPVSPYRGRDKWGDVALDVSLAVLGGLLGWGALTALGDVPFVRALGVYTAGAAGATLVLAVVRAGTRRLPVLEREEAGDSWVLRAWPGDWSHATLLDLGLGVLGVWLAALGLRAGGDLVAPAVAVGVAGAWFLVRVGLTVAGRRSRETLRVTPEQVVHDSPWGRVWCPRDAVVGVTARGSRLVLRLDRPVEQRPCPRPWRRRRRGAADDEVVVDCSLTGHAAAGLARWCQDRLRASSGAVD